MAISEKTIKEEITKRWDYSSQLYDGYHGHGIKSAEETAAWIDLFRRVIPGERLNILDVGCGTGEISLVLAGMGHRVTGIDLSEKMLGRAVAKAKTMSDIAVEFNIGDAEQPPFAPGSFDAVVTRHVLWTLPNPQKAVNNWANVLKEGGKAVVVDGLWNDGSLATLLRKKATAILIRLLEGRDISKDRYAAGLNSALPNAKGVTTDRSREYLQQAGLKDIELIMLDYLVNIQKRNMPFRYKIGYKYNYYAIHGLK
jgi:ubiquinone/menaquinone biosynthesis C-methylase UbiE